MFRRISQLAVLLLIFGAAPGLAEEEIEDVNQSRWRLGAAFGYGVRTNPLVQADDIPIIVDVDIAWFGDHWFFDNGDLGLTFADNHTLTASVVARFNSDRIFFGKTDTRFVSFGVGGLPLSEAVEFKVPDRDYAIELGLEMLTDGPWGRLQLTAFHDVSNTHEGYELYADYSFGWRKQRLYLEPSFGASYKSANLNNYYWGVTDAEAGMIVAPYEAGAGVNWHTRFKLGYQLSRHWAVSIVAEYERINDEAAASPIVEDRNVLGYFTGVSYRF